MGSLRPARPLFLKWALLNALAVIFLTVLGVEYHDQLRGAPLVVTPLILAVAVYASALGGRMCWRAEGASPFARDRILHEARYLSFWAWVCQMVGILSTVIGFWLLLQGDGSTEQLGDRIQEGGGTALLGTFVGVLASLLLAMEHRLIEHDLEG